MKRSEIGDLTCSLAAALSQVGDAWSLLIVKELMLRNTRFDGIAAQTGVAESSLAQRLKRLEAFGILERRAYQTRPVRYEYELTEKGRGLWPVLATLSRWGDGWRGRDTPPITYGCKCCGVADSRPRLACESCGEALMGNTIATMSPAMQSEREALARGETPTPS